MDIEVELETDPEIKDQKFDKMLAATRQIIKKRSELEKTVKETTRTINNFINYFEHT